MEMLHIFITINEIFLVVIILNFVYSRYLSSLIYHYFLNNNNNIRKIQHFKQQKTVNSPYYRSYD
jgi:hypothetical protein